MVFSEIPRRIGRQFQNCRAAHAPVGYQQRALRTELRTGQSCDSTVDHGPHQCRKFPVPRLKSRIANAIRRTDVETEKRRKRINDFEVQPVQHRIAAPFRISASSHNDYIRINVRICPALRIRSERYPISFSISRLVYYLGHTAARPDIDLFMLHQRQEDIDNLHRILRNREHALVGLGHQTHAGVLEPAAYVNVAEFLQQAFHESVTARIYLLHAAHFLE